ncbi:hypothetical protein EVAR_14048_1 [Eumeta japonica]|uniref:Uncharacterized protein n=1 Tax=Eumeta variegata TaxID=151549 RepID=A0A4C1UNT4_EUMVA|nr:hypothetical protein EVAR_14048_1 [Eumeta japonica]
MCGGHVRRSEKAFLACQSMQILSLSSSHVYVRAGPGPRRRARRADRIAVYHGRVRETAGGARMFYNSESSGSAVTRDTLEQLCAPVSSL